MGLQGIQGEQGIQGIQGESGLTPSLRGLSTTSTAIGTGSKTFAISPAMNVAFPVGATVKAQGAASANYMVGVVTAATTTSVTINVTETGGAGTFASWTLTIGAYKGADGTGTVNTVNSVAPTSGNVNVTRTISVARTVSDEFSNGKYALIGTFTLTSAFSDATLAFEVVSGANTAPNRGRFVVKIRNPSAVPGAPTVMQIAQVDGTAAGLVNNMRLVHAQQNPTNNVIELWIAASANFVSYEVYEVGRAYNGTFAASYSGQGVAWAASMSTPASGVAVTPQLGAFGDRVTIAPTTFSSSQPLDGLLVSSIPASNGTAQPVQRWTMTFGLASDAGGVPRTGLAFTTRDAAGAVTSTLEGLSVQWGSATNPLVGLGTTAPTHTLTLPSTSTGAAHYNTTDQITNYERLRTGWGSNVYTLFSEAGGTGVVRDLRLSAVGFSHFTLGGASATAGAQVRRDSTTIGTLFQVVSTGLTASSGTQVGLLIDPTINQSGTAGYAALRVNATETATGSGTKDLLSLMTGGSTRLSVNSGGTISQIMPAHGTAHGISQIGDTASRFVLQTNGTMSWGSGSANTDVVMSRAGAGQMAINGTLVSTAANDNLLTLGATINQSGTGGYRGLFIGITETATGSGIKRPIDVAIGGVSRFIVGNTGTIRVNTALSGDFAETSYVDGDTQPRFIRTTAGAMSWGVGGSTAIDTTLQRIGAGVLRLDGTMRFGSTATPLNEGVSVNATDTGAAPALALINPAAAAAAVGTRLAFQGTSGVLNQAQIFGAWSGAATTDAYLSFVVRSSNSLPEVMRLTGGNATVTGVLNATGQVQENGTRVYSPNNKPTPAALGAEPAARAINAQTGTSYTFVLTDADKVVTFSNVGAVTATVPASSTTAFPIGTYIEISNLNTGDVTLAAAGGVTLRSPAGLKIADQYGTAGLRKIGTDEWMVMGRTTT